MERRYQVFVSSTYADLKQEREQVTQTLMQMDCIPVGMELFPAADEEQFEFIKKVIEDCDYYLLIIGGRYGSVTSEGISYTEKEFDYAVERGLRVTAFLHKTPDKIPFNKSETDLELQKKLQTFRERVSSGRLVKLWEDAKDLPGLVSLSLHKTIKMYPSIGWIRASNISNEELLGELNELRKENESLKAELSNIRPASLYGIQDEDLAGLDEKFTVYGTLRRTIGGGVPNKWSHDFSWSWLFSMISPYLGEYVSESDVENKLNSIITEATQTIGKIYINNQNFQTIKIQFKALNLISTTISDGYFWSLTPEGEKLMIRLRTVKSSIKKSSEE